MQFCICLSVRESELVFMTSRFDNLDTKFSDNNLDK